MDQGMRDVVIEQFIPFNIPKEGRVRHMYADVLGLITIGIGNLIDPMSVAMGLPFQFGDNLPAASSEIAVEWQNLKHRCCGEYKDPRHCAWRLVDGSFDPQRPCMAHQGHLAAAKFTKLWLSEFEIGKLCAAKMREMWGHLLTYIPRLEEWPSDAQMGLLSMAWAMGPGFLLHYPGFLRAARAKRFDECSRECTMREDNNPGVKPRNAANRILFMNGHWIEEHGLDRDSLFYPRVLTIADAPKIVDADNQGDITIEISPIPLLGDPFTVDESRGYYESDGGFARRNMLSDYIANTALDEITRRNDG